MRSLMTFAVAFAMAAAAFGVTMLTKPPVSEARVISTIDTRALTLGAHPADALAYDCQ